MSTKLAVAPKTPGVYEQNRMQEILRQIETQWNGGAANLGFLQSGTGATAGTVQAELRRTYYFEQFGAVGDGATDDTADVQACINAVLSAGGGIAKGTPGKTYLVSKTGSNTVLGTANSYCLLVPNNVIVDLNGSTVKLANSANASIFMNSTAGTTQNTDVELLNGILDGNYLNQTSAASGEMACVYLYNVLRPKVKNIYAKNARQYFGRFLACDTGVFDDLRGITSYGDGWSFGTSANSQAVIRSLIDNVYSEGCLGTYSGNVGNGIIGVYQYCNVGKLTQKDCAGGLKIQDASQDSNFGELICIGKTNGSVNSGVKVEGSSGASLYPTRISIGSITSQNCYGKGLWVNAINSVSIGQYTGNSNGSGSGASGSDQNDAQVDLSNGNGPNVCSIGRVTSDTPTARGLLVTCGSVAARFDSGSVYVMSPTGPAVQLAADSNQRLHIDRISAVDNGSGMTYALQVSGGVKGRVASVETNVTHSISQSRVTVPSANYDFTVDSIRLGSTDVSEGVVQLGNGATTTAVTCGHIWRDYVGGTSDYFHPIINVTAWTSSAGTLMGTSAIRATVTDGSSGTGFTLNHPSAGAADYVFWKVLGWKVTSNAAA